MFPLTFTCNGKVPKKAMEGKKVKVKGVIFFIAVILLLPACSVKTMDEAIEGEIPFNVKEVIHQEKVKGGMVLLYLTHQKNQREAFDAVTVAFLKGSDGEGWENAGHNHWDYKKGERLTTYTDAFYIYDHKGKLEYYIPVIFGEIKDKDIQTVEVLGKNNQLVSAQIIEKDSGRYFYKTGEYKAARGISRIDKGAGPRLN